MKSLVLCFTLLLSAHSLANNGRAYGLLNTARSFVETGHSTTMDVRTEIDAKSEGIGLGAEYRLPVPNKDLNLNLGLLYEFQRKFSQVTQAASGAVSTGRDNLPKFQMTSLYISNYFNVADKISVVLGLAYYIPQVDGKEAFKDYDIDAGMGYHFGVDFQLGDNFFVQILRKQVALKTQDNNSYEGQVDLSNISFLFGKEF